MAKYYAVKKGRTPGIYMSWDECKEQVQGYSGAVYKSFPTMQEAMLFVGEKKVEVSGHGLLAYVDGSYNIKTKEYGYGMVLLEGQTVIKKAYGKGDNPDYAAMRNVSGEIIGCMQAVKYAIDQGYDHICIYYDYEGIEKWATGMWKANKYQTQHYVKVMNSFKQHIQIQFMKVLAHSGDTYNEMADSLAKKAVGIK